ncbi:hypothetical protein ACHHYP_05561 [Achlya hypogyna]|uniref:Uncharacterized protein n=1 Tax=Achlya hypogyna TaxID=1202772 RepID=A0A1V9YXB3_ACHHY|nr:hypothetical protein ACHHYP_05561 [Achlya hypogyna]
METLAPKRRAGPVRVATDASLSLSFKLPSSYVSTLARAVPVVLDARTAPVVQDAWDDDGDDSWETKADVLLDVAAAEDTSMEAWQDDLEAFPDDFPLLLVNLSRLSLEHMGAPLTSNEDAARVSASIQDVFDSNKFSYVIETLFEQEIAHHTTYGVYKQYLEYLSKQSNDVWATVDYPALVDDDVPLSDLLAVLHRPTQWTSVNHIKEYMRKTSRDIKWKAQVLEEVENLAAFEQDTKDAAEAQLRDEIKSLSELREVLAKKLKTTKSTNATARRLIQLQLSDVEKRLEPLLETALAPPAPPALFAASIGADASYSKAGLSVGHMSVLDMILSMVFSRLPQPPQVALDAHFTSLMQSHEHVRHLWLQDFGRLPPRTTVDEDGDVVEVEPALPEAVPAVKTDEEDETAQETAQEAVEETKTQGYESDAYKGGDEDDSETEASRERKRLKKKKKKKTKKAVPFEPFACVAGISLLRLTEDEQQMYG